jgi:hypothetical protein
MAVAYTYRDDDRELPPRRVKGKLTMRWVTPLRYWQYAVGGALVDPDTLEPSEQEAQYRRATLMAGPPTDAI